jgi:hypothetical protein
MKISAKFKEAPAGRKWEYATITLKSPKGWSGFSEYNYGPALYRDGRSLTIHVRRKKRVK